MAGITLAKVNLPTTNHVIGNRREVCVDATLDNAYTVGGYALTPKTLGVDLVTDFIRAEATTTGHQFVYDYANSKLKVYLSGTEITASVDLSTVVCRISAHGKGPGL